ncbi:hypothetical protein T552_01480 [Pneumocystis carinii B80]|uniref:Conserved oligomeric Golgi complex subunit 5 n=1 Tax=Pneumocystis carinii (strain B80) TaxID=1408658 RepID=A0A0W4ZKE6_PNEC8|nr:hypothetical protein T552_01480 [Pneumocystis carinii B80]KTW28851.1 hypothetical protein T552_01480 [Pneumocystis carinii B80]
MTSKKYINYERLDQPIFDVYKYANTIIKETHNQSDHMIDIEVPLKKIQYDLEEIMEEIQEELKEDHNDLINHVKFIKESSNENIEWIKKYTEPLVGLFEEMDEKWTSKYESASCLLVSLKNNHITSQLLREVQESIILLKHLKSLHQEMKSHVNETELWKECLRMATIIKEWKTILRNLMDILIIREYIPFVTSVSNELESMAYDAIFVKKYTSKNLLVSIISTYFLLNEDALISNLKKYNSQSIKDAVEYFYKSIEINLTLKRLSITDSAKATSILLTNIEKGWSNIENISKNIYHLNEALEESIPFFLKETFLTHKDTIISNILEKLNDQSSIQYFWKQFSSQLILKIKDITKQSLWLNKILSQESEFILKLIQKTLHQELHNYELQKLILENIKSSITQKK